MEIEQYHVTLQREVTQVGLIMLNEWTADANIFLIELYDYATQQLGELSNQLLTEENVSAIIYFTQVTFSHLRYFHIILTCTNLKNVLKKNHIIIFKLSLP